MSNLIDWLKSQGQKAIDATTDQIKSVILDFNKKALEIEKEYARQYALAEFMGEDYPHETYLHKLAESVTGERDKRMWLLKAMYAVNINPAEYGVFTAGLNAGEVEKAYPGYKFSAVPILLIDAAVVITFIVAASSMASILAEKEKYDVFTTLTQKYVDAGMPMAQAREAAMRDLEAIKKQTGLTIGEGIASIGSLVKLGVAAAVAISIWGN